MLLAKKKSQKSAKYILRVHITLRSPFVEIEDVKTVSTHRIEKICTKTDFSDEFRIHCRTRSFILYTDTREEKDSWMTDLRRSVKGEHPEELNNNDKELAKIKRREEEDDSFDKKRRPNTDDEVGIRTKERRASRTQPDIGKSSYFSFLTLKQVQEPRSPLLLIG